MFRRESYLSSFHLPATNSELGLSAVWHNRPAEVVDELEGTNKEALLVSVGATWEWNDGWVVVSEALAIHNSEGLGLLAGSVVDLPLGDLAHWEGAAVEAELELDAWNLDGVDNVAGVIQNLELPVANIWAGHLNLTNLSGTGGDGSGWLEEEWAKAGGDLEWLVDLEAWTGKGEGSGFWLWHADSAAHGGGLLSMLKLGTGLTLVWLSSWLPLHNLVVSGGALKEASGWIKENMAHASNLIFQ